MTTKSRRGLSIVFVLLTFISSAVSDNIRTSNDNYFPNNNTSEKVWNESSDVRDRVSRFNATMKRVGLNNSLCVNWTTIKEYLEEYDVSMLEYLDGNKSDIPLNQRRGNHWNSITLKLTPKLFPSLCEDINIADDDWWNASIDFHLSNDAIEQVNSCEYDTEYYHDAFLIRPPSNGSNYVLNGCSLKTILSNIHKIDNRIMSSPLVSVKSNKTRPIILPKEWVHDIDIEEIIFNSVQLLMHIQLILMPYVNFLDLDYEINLLLANNKNVMSPYYMDSLSTQWNLTYGLIVTTDDKTDMGTTGGTILTWILFCLATATFIIFGTIPSLITNEAAISNTTNNTQDHSENSNKDRKHDFDTLPKIPYHHDTCTYSKRKLMIEYPSIERENHPSPTSLTNHNNGDNMELTFQNCDSIEASESIVMAVLHDSQEVPTEILEAPQPDNNNDVENKLATETGHINSRFSQSSFKRLSSIYSAHNTLCMYDNDETIHHSAECHEECPICFEEYLENEVVVILPLCRHMYHIPCLEQWVIRKKSNICPLCKTQIIDAVEV